MQWTLDCQCSRLKDPFMKKSSAGVLQLPENASDQIPFQDSFDFPVAQSFAGAPLHVFLGSFIATHAVFGDDVQSHVQLAVSVAVEPVPDGVPRRSLQRCSSGGSGKGRFGAEPTVVRIGGEDDPDGHRSEPRLGLQPGSQLFTQFGKKGPELFQADLRRYHALGQVD